MRRISGRLFTSSMPDRCAAGFGRAWARDLGHEDEFVRDLVLIEPVPKLGVTDTRAVEFAINKEYRRCILTHVCER